MSDSRPKKTSASSSQNANRPLYGHRGMSHPEFLSDDRTLLSGRVTADAMHSVVGPPSAAATCSCTPSWQPVEPGSCGCGGGASYEVLGCQSPLLAARELKHFSAVLSISNRH